jgi:SET domain-containing protein
MEILRSDGLTLRVSEGKGRGVFAARAFRQGEVLMVNAVLVFGENDATKVGETALAYYHFNWPFGPNGEDIDADESPYSCIPFGLIALINHGREDANASWIYSRELMTMTAVALRDISADEEILWDYHWDGEEDEESVTAEPSSETQSAA